MLDIPYGTYVQDQELSHRNTNHNTSPPIPMTTTHTATMNRQPSGLRASPSNMKSIYFLHPNNFP